MSSEISNLGSSGSAEQLANDSADSSAEPPASLCLFARLPSEIWRQLIGLLPHSDVAACSCSTSHEDTKRLFALKLESLFKVVWRRRKHVLARLRKDCNLTLADETYEIPQKDMPDMWQLRLLSNVL